jgi:hypothetical protein
MDILLLALTIVSLTIAAAMTIVAWKLRRDARRRSDARVAVLEALAFGDEGEQEPRERHDEPGDTHQPTEAPIAGAPVTGGAYADRHAAPPVVTAAPLVMETASPASPSWDAALGVHGGRNPVPDRNDVDLDVAAVPAAMFAPAAKTSAGARRAGVVAAVAIVMMVGVSAAYVVRGDFAWPSAAVMHGPSAAAARDAGQPLELLSLRHDVPGPGQFTVTGLVQNPQQGRAVSGLVAVVYLFDGQGRFLASGRAPLEYSALRPGDEAPFVVTIPATTEEVTRYRVGFRLEDGAVVSHVDRRGQAPANTTGDAIDVDPPAGRARRVEG